MNDIPGHKTLFTEVSKLMKLYLVVPLTSCTSERSFSTLRRLKNYLRSRMTQRRLNDLMFLHVYKDLTDELDKYKIAKYFIDVNDRRIAYFGKQI